MPETECPHLDCKCGEELENRIRRLVMDEGVAALLSIPGVWECVYESDLREVAIKELEAEKEEQEEEEDEESLAGISEFIKPS